MKKIGTIPAGELVLRVPGAIIKEKYAQSYISINEDGSIVKLSLILDSMEAEECKGGGLFSSMGPMMVEQIKSDEFKEHFKLLCKGRAQEIYYSITEDGKEVITIPGTSGEDGVDTENFENCIVMFYANAGEIRPVEEVEKLHNEVIMNLSLQKNEKALSEVAAKLVEKVNGICEEAVKLAVNLSF